PNSIKIKPYKIIGTGEILSEYSDAILENVIEGVNIKLKDTKDEFDLELAKKIYENKEKYLDFNDGYIEVDDEDIERLKSYAFLNGVGTNFEEMYDKYNKHCKGVMELFHPSMTTIYKRAKVEFKCDPRLVYINELGAYCLRGILRLQYLSSDNRYNLNQNVWYERDVEYQYRYSTDGKFLHKIIYYSNLKEE
ncbi:MAG: hypothetical protein MJA82_08470, partial [Clostridia bacterium]|nr:hypothetical protein [Clostridia bacterium]